MAVFAIDAWGLHLFGSLVVAYLVVLASALAVAGAQRLLERRRAVAVGRARSGLETRRPRVRA